MKRAFTLVELLVVIVIIVVIAAILFPYDHYLHTHKSRSIACLSNMKQLGLSTLMYAQDYDEHFPPAAKWMTLTIPYTHPQVNNTLFRCPTALDEAPKALASYAMDSRLSGLSEKKIKEPTNRVLLYDSTRTDWDATDPGQTFATRHDKKGNVTFADGHAKQVSREQFAAASLSQAVDKQ